MRRIDSVVVGVAALALYLRFCPPVTGLGDSAELELVLATNGVAHPTGYPLYTLVGHCAVLGLHALGLSWAFAANAWSAIGGAVAIGFLHALGSEAIASTASVGRMARFALPLLALAPLAIDPVMMDAATQAEVNVWSVAWTCMAAYAFARIVRRIGACGTSSPAPLTWIAAAWGLACGAGVAHHMTSLFIAAPLSVGIVVALSRRRSFAPRLLFVGLASAALPVASYGIIAWRAWHPAAVQWPLLVAGWRSVLAHVTGLQYHGFLGRFAPDAGNLLGRAIYPLLIPGLACLLVAAARAKDEVEATLRWSLLAAAAVSTGFSFRYGVPDPEPYFLAPIALGVAGAAALAADGLGARFMNGARRAIAGACAVAGLVALAGPWTREAAGVKRELVDYEVLIREMWQSIPPDTAIVLWQDDRVMRLRGYQILRGEKGALYVATPDALVAPPVRAAIVERFGVDPMAGLTIPNTVPGAPGHDEAADRFLHAAVRNLNTGTSVPVIEFDPSVPIVRKLYKPWERPPASAG